MKKLLLLVTVFASLMTVSLVGGGVALAYNPLAAGCDAPNNGTLDSSVGCSNKDSTVNPVTGKNGVILKGVNLVALITGVAAVVAIIISGIKFVTSGGDSAKVTNAKDTLMYAVIGLVVIVVARSLVVFVINKV